MSSELDRGSGAPCGHGVGLGRGVSPGRRVSLGRVSASGRARSVAAAVVACLLATAEVVPPARATTGASPAASWGRAVAGAPLGGRAQAGGPRFYPDDPVWVDPDDMDIPEPAEWEASEYYDGLENLFLDPGDPVRGRAVNVNTLGEVPDSSWFTNRHGLDPRLSREELVRGPNTTGGPASGTWTVVGKTGGGVTPNFMIEDERGDVYVIKFDPLTNPEMASAAEAISTRFFHAFGYHVPENYVVYFSADRLVIDPEATYRDFTGLRRPITDETLDRWLGDVPRTPDGGFRALASLFVEGTPVGTFRFHGTRADDPNDIFPHESRRELRGLRVFSAWLNHDDSRSVNTLDTWVQEDGRGFIRHHLIDFGSTLGSASIFAQKRRAGNEYMFEPDKFFKGIYTFGLWVRPWVTVEYPDYPSIGRFEGDFFEPEQWRPEYPNAAFRRMDAADAFWGARIASRFTDDDVRALVETGELSDPQAQEYLIEVLVKRRDKVVAHWLTGTNPLDDFATSGDRLRFDNAAVQAGVAAPATSYRVRWFSLDNDRDERREVGGAREFDGGPITIPEAAWGAEDRFGLRYAVAEIATMHPAYPGWIEPVVVALRRGPEGVEVVGIERPG